MTEPTWHELHWPSPLTTERALEMLRRLAAEPRSEPLIVEAIGESGHVHYRLAAPASAVEHIRHLLGALVPGTLLDTSQLDALSWTQTLRLRLEGASLGIRSDRLEASSRAVLEALAATRVEERLLLQLVIGPGSPARLSPDRPSDPSQSLISQLSHGPRRAPSDVAKRLRDKAGEPALLVAVRLAAGAGEGRTEQLLRGVIAALRLSQTAGTTMTFSPARLSRRDRLPRRGFIRLSSAEVLALAGWPLGGEPLPGRPEPHPRQLRLRSSEPERSRVFAVTTAPGPSLPLGISIKDALQHTVVAAPTGAGKSNLLLHLITADMQAGRSVVVIDPKSDLVRDALPRVPESRRDDVVVLDPTQIQPIGLNPFSQPGRSPELVADSMLTLVRELFPNLFGPRTSDVLHAALLTIAPAPGATLTWLPRLLTDASLRRTLLPLIEDETLVSFWQQFDALSPAQQAQFVGPVLSRLRQFLLRPQMRRVLDQPEPRFQLADLFQAPRLLFVPLNSGLLGGETARLLGSLLVSQLWGLGLARAARPTAERTPVSIYIDEAQEFLHLGGELPDALARSRSLGVAWHLAHQYRDQLTPEVRAAIDANAHNKIAFSLGIKDAREMAAMAPGLDPEDFLALPRFHFYADLLNHGRHSGWVSGRTLPPPPEVSDANDLIARSQRRYGAQNAAAPRLPPTQGEGERLFGRKPRSK